MNNPNKSANPLHEQILEHNPLLMTGEVMNTGVTTAFPETPLLEVIKLMLYHSADSVVIVSEADRTPVGIITTRDILRLTIENQALANLRAENVMSGVLITALPDMPLPEAYNLLETHHLGQLVVTGKQGELAGTISRANYDPAMLFNVIPRSENQKCQRQEAEERIQKLSKLYATMSQSNQAIIRTDSRESLFHEICRIAVEFGGMKMAWVATPDYERKVLVKASCYGRDLEYLDTLLISIDPEKLESKGIGGKAFLEKQHFIANGFTEKESNRPCHIAAKAKGLAAAAAFPLFESGEIIGLLILYSGESQYFDPEIVQLLDEMAQNISFALEKFTFEKKRAAGIRELEKSNERFSKIFYASPISMSIFRASDFKLLEANDSFFKQTGFSRENLAQFQGIAPREKLYPSLQQADKFLEALTNNSKLTDYELEFYNKNGEILIMLLSTESMELGGEACFVIQAINITARKRAEEALRMSEARFQTFMNNSPALSWITDDNGNIVYLSPTYGRVTGIDVEKATGKSAYEIYPKDYADDFIATIRQVAETGQNVEIVESFPRPDGTLGYVLSYKFPLPHFSEQRLVGGVAIDITEREHAKEALRLSEERYRKVTELITDYAYSYLINPDGTYTPEWFTEESFYRLTGYRLSEIDQDNILMLIHPDDREEARKNFRAAAGTEKFRSEYRIITKSGEVRWITFLRQAEWDIGHERVIRMFGSLKDITERKLAKDALRESEQKFIKLFRANPAAITLGNMNNGFFVDVNDKWVELTGYKPEELIGHDFRDLHLWQIPENGKNIITELVTKGYYHNFETKLYKKNGETIDALNSFDLIEIDGQMCALSFSIDITERKRAEEALRDKEEQFRALVENSPDLIMRMDRQLRMVYGNPAVLKFSHRSQQQIYGKIGTEMGMAQSTWNSVCEMAQKVEETKTMQVTETNGTVHDQMFYFQTRLIPEFNASGEIETLLSVTTDITALKRAQEELINQARFKTLFEFSPDSVILMDRAGTIISLNRAVEELLGYSPQELIGRKGVDFKLIPPDIFEQFIAVMIKAENSALPYLFEFEITKRNGKQLAVEARAHALMLEGQTHILIAFRDITRHKDLEYELRAAIEKQRELTELKSRFVSMASHEFRTPLTIILSAAQLLEKYMERFTPERVAELYKRIVVSVRNMTDLLDEMLFLNRAEAGKLECKPTMLDLSLFCNEVVEEIRFGAGTQHFFQIEIAPPPRLIAADVKLLRPVVANLLYNAVKYSPKERTIRFKLEYTATQAHGTVIDEGIGIPSENLKQLFEVFYRADNVGDIQGTGLGLAIVKKSLLAHGGDIEIESAENKGTTCRFWIPI
ncbi:MAG: PAS domain S-box protein [Chloroflexi bacterium]|uniref:histidine kinase n=1 Tax=Candidatus Chlorohelix allophototropha TaxID=3003348 RepID=A0A8T7MA44_9CHLR|nr:PAS domain S-box protein [Chloroflexota bacterium]WJW68723.1 PAS domain S-box protein [Chloroflexota bacterium L227-S17]